MELGLEEEECGVCVGWRGRAGRGLLSEEGPRILEMLGDEVEVVSAGLGDGARLCGKERSH